MYIVKVNKEAAREIQKLPPSFQDKVVSKIKELGVNPRPMGVRKIKVEEGLWRVRVGKYRVIYIINDKTKKVEVLYVRKRADAYR